MSTTQITVKQVWKPFKPTDKRTNVDDTNGGKWRIDVAKTSALAPGCLYEIDYTEENFNGRGYNLIGEIRQLAGASGNEKPVVVKAGNGKGEVDIRSLLGTGHMYPNGVPSKAQILRDLWELHDAVDAFNRGIRPGPMEAEKFAKIRKTIDDVLYNKYAENEDPSNGFGEFED